ncbi:hypothetical protein F0562_032359 [Nyssa sinensis]|uniref:Pentatricopeptide repeat-containing protein n=1 Tax=Nyssa sinensis TaxID=561372 RepID=A0A5J5ARD9_9ASTE|nr:hypothetical protein F0562_032359 [Nyssa sinensis]
MHVRNEVSWTAMMVGYANVRNLEQAKKLFDEMPSRNLVSWNVMIGTLVRFGDLRNARKLFDEMPERNVVSFTVMIDGYAKAGDMASARFLFEQSPDRDIVSWSALISGYTQNGQPNEAVKLFVEMGLRNVKPDEFIMVSLMSACSQVGSLELAKWVDAHVSQNSFDLRRAHVAAALIDMNAKCGNMDRATLLFEEMPKRDLISYCSMIQGLSIHGHGAQAVGLFARMLNEGLAPDDVAFTVILTACSHVGLVEEGCRYFDSMINDYSIVPSPDHYACMVDLLGRSGNVKAAYELIKSMPVEPHAGAWGALLGACKLHCDIELGEEVAGQLFELEPLNAGQSVEAILPVGPRLEWWSGEPTLTIAEYNLFGLVSGEERLFGKWKHNPLSSCRCFSSGDEHAKLCVIRFSYQSLGSCHVLENHWVNITAHLFNAPSSEDKQVIGVGTVGSSKAIIFAGFAFKKKWQNKKKAEGKPFDKLIVPSVNIQMGNANPCRCSKL